MKYDLLKTVEQGGCSSKISPKQLEEILKDLPLPADPDILVDIATHDDAGVYRLDDNRALVFTTDFFPPVCSDPFEFGEIAAANSLSDVYAMGAKPILALNIMMFPSADMPLEVYKEILKGGYSKTEEAGVRIIGGHSIDDTPPKYGLAVIGIVNPERVITNSKAVAGDILILTKPVGTGIVMAGGSLSMASDREVGKALDQMKSLNSKAAELMQRNDVRAATDITGFGLAGHALKMARASNVTIEISIKNVPLLEGAYRLVDEGCLPGASFRNLDYVEKDLFTGPDIDYNLKMLSLDAQTSGGILMSVNESISGELLEQLVAGGCPDSAIIGKVIKRGDSHIILK